MGIVDSGAAVGRLVGVGGRGVGDGGVGDGGVTAWDGAGVGVSPTP